MQTLTATILAVVVLLGGATGPADDPTTYRTPDEVTGSLVYNPAGDGVGTASSGGPGEPVLEVVARDCKTDWGNIEPNLVWALQSPMTVTDPSGSGQVVIEAGEYTGWRCSDTASGIPVAVHPDHGPVDASPARPYTAWTEEQVTAMIEATGQGGVVIEDVPLTAEPGPGGEPLVVLTAGTELEAVGLPVDGQLERGRTLVSGNYLPARVDGYTGWLPVEAVRSAPVGGLASLGVDTEEVTVGTVADALTDAPGIAVYPIDRALDPEAPSLRRGDPLTHLEAGDRVTASVSMWETLGGGGWLGFALSEARISELPESTQHLGRTGRLVETEDGRVGWAYAYLTLDAAALGETAAPTTEPTAAVPTIGAPDPTDETAALTTDAPAVDPMTVPLTTTVERRGNRVGVPSAFSILSQPSDDAPTLGVIEEGQVYRASEPFTGEDSLTHGDQWRAIELADGRAFVHDDDVIESTRPAPTEAPAAGQGVIDRATDKATELVDEGTERWENRERGAWNPVRSLTRTLAYAVAIPIALAATGLLCLGGYRASVVASGRRTRAGITPVGRLLAVAPTTLGATLAVVAAWLMPGTTVGWVVTGLLAALAGAVVMARGSSRRSASLTPDLTGVTWDRLVLHTAPVPVIGAAAWWLLGLMPAVVLAAAGVGAGLAMAGARTDQPDPGEQPAPVSEPDEQPVEQPADPYDLGQPEG